MRTLAITVAAAVAMLVATACEETTPQLVEESPAADSEETAESGEGQSDAEGPYKIGDTVAMGDLQHTLHGARWSAGDEFLAPAEGEGWLVLDIEVTNTGDSSESISSLLMWSLVDEENRAADITVTGDERGSLDGELGPGRSLRGELAYSVSAGGEQWELIFEPQVFGTGQAIYTIAAADVAEG